MIRNIELTNIRNDFVDHLNKDIIKYTIIKKYPSIYQQK